MNRATDDLIMIRGIQEASYKKGRADERKKVLEIIDECFFELIDDFYKSDGISNLAISNCENRIKAKIKQLAEEKK